jgi:hypothetical protein
LSLVVILVADGARPDVLAQALDGGALPALAQLREEGALSTVATAFPSVTGPAYAPFLMGRFPGPVGLPGLRWFDRARTRATWPDATRSYVGAEMRHVDRDLAPDAPTLFELAPSGLAALNVIGRGLPMRDRMGRGLRFIARTARTHFTGHIAGWLDIDRDVGAQVAQRVRQARADGSVPRAVFCALTGIDKTSHAAGHAAPLVHDAMGIVDAVAAEVRADAERGGWWRDTHLWIVSDHGHSPVRSHDDLADWFRERGHRTVAHPFTLARGREVAVMVSGNAMAHVYLELGRRQRPWWPELAPRWGDALDDLVARPSVDLALLPHSPDVCEVRGRGRGAALVVRTPDPGVASSGRDAGTPPARAFRYSYRPLDGDPLGLGGPQERLDADAAYDACAVGDYPDALVQIAHLAGAPRSGEIIVSAARQWDLRAHYEPIPHVSSHGALHREHMLVPLLTSRRPSRVPRRTVDVMPSALVALGLSVPAGLDGESFV